MKDLMIEWRKFLQEEMKVIVGKAKDFVCPPATQDLKLNTKNRDASIKAEHIQYGPLNVDEPGDYWKDIAEYWNTTCLLYTSPSPRDVEESRMPSSA